MQVLNLVIDMENLSQVTVYIHQHKDILPECSEPYGLYNIQLRAPTNAGKFLDKWFNLKDYKMNGLPRRQLPCKAVNDDEKLDYDGGIGKCIFSKFSFDLSKCSMTYLVLAQQDIWRTR